jgi:hypothetical protein
MPLLTVCDNCVCVNVIVCQCVMHYYKSVIRPTIEYACPVWQYGLTDEQRDRLESLQRRTLQLISNSHDYTALNMTLSQLQPGSITTQLFVHQICFSIIGSGLYHSHSCTLYLQVKECPTYIRHSPNIRYELNSLGAAVCNAL